MRGRYLFLINFELALLFTLRAVANADFFAGFLDERPKRNTAVLAIEVDFLQLREYSASPRDDARHSNEVVEMSTPQIAKCHSRRQIGDTDVDFGVDAFVMGKADENDRKCNLIENVKHGAWANNEEVCNSREIFSEVSVRDLE